MLSYVHESTVNCSRSTNQILSLQKLMSTDAYSPLYCQPHTTPHHHGAIHHHLTFLHPNHSTKPDLPSQAESLGRALYADQVLRLKYIHPRDWSVIAVILVLWLFIMIVTVVTVLQHRRKCAKMNFITAV